MKTVLAFRVFGAVLFSLGLAFSFSGACRAADEGAPFRVTSAVLRPEAPKVELCLSFSSPLDLASRARVLAAIDLRKEGKKERLSPKDLSLTPMDLCVQNLDHKARYDFLLRRILNEDGEKLARPFETSFVAPDRKAALSFVANAHPVFLPRHVKASAGAASLGAETAHVLRSVNVGQTHLTLFRVAAHEDWAGAWQQFRQINLSPSESLTFARSKGKAVFESDLVFSDNRNVEQTLVAPLPADSDLAPGLYYLAASPKDAKELRPGLFAGQWFLVSDLRLSAVRLPDGVRAFAGDLASRRPAAGARVYVMARDGDVLAEGRTGEDGSVFLPVPRDKNEKVALLAGEAAAGDPDLLEIGREFSSVLASPSVKAFVRVDREIYQPGSTVAATLRAENPAGKVLAMKNSSLKLLRPDRRVYSQQMVPEDKAGAHLLNKPLPMVGKAGDWILSWQDSGGAVLAEAPVHIAPDAAVEKLDLSLARDLNDGDEAASLVLKARDAQGRPLAFKTGKVVLRAARPEVQAWKRYRFGSFVPEDEAPLREAAFLTGADGAARINVSLEGLEGGVDLALSASLDENMARARLLAPVRRRSSLIGVRPLTEGAAFPENGVARFEVIAVDASGKRRAEGELYSVVYEEGRSFEWFPSEGHWDYTPLPKRRRVGGGPLAISAASETLVSWPVTTGQYVLEIVDADGDVLASQPFEAGRFDGSAAQVGASLRLRLAQPLEALEEKRENKIHLHLDAPAFVSADLFDGKERAHSLRFMPAGDGELSFTPGEGWGQQAALRVQASFADSPVPESLERLVDIRSARRALALDIAAPRRLIAGAGASIPVRVQKVQGRLPTFVSVVATAVSATGETDLPVMRLDRVPVEADGRAQIKINVPLFEGKVRLFVMGWNDSQYGEKSVDIPAGPLLAISGEPPDRMDNGDKVETPLRIVNRAAPEGFYTYEVHLPSGLSADQPLKGRFALKRNAEQLLPLTLTARDPVEDVIRLEINGPGGIHVEKAWPALVRPEGRRVWTETFHSLEPGKKSVFPAMDQGKRTLGAIGFLSPLKLPPMAAALQDFAYGKPRTTAEISLWLEVAPLLAEPMRALGLMSEGRLSDMRAAFLREIQLRQNEDGGFSAYRMGETGTLVSTSAALNLLQGQAERPAALAADWLIRKLQNTWFEEGERESRAFSFEAIARANRTDLSALRYFAETSRDKPFSPSASAALALALARAGDNGAVGAWLSRAREGLSQLKKSDKEEAWRTLWFLIGNDRFSPDDVKAALALAPALSPESSFTQTALALGCFAKAASRMGTWSVQVNGREASEDGLMVLTAPEEKGQTLSLQSAQPLTLETLTPQAAKPSAKAEGALAISAAFLKADGSPLSFDTSLMVGEPYLLILRGEKGDAGGALRLVLPKSAAFTVSLSKDTAALRALFPWLPEPLAALRDGVDLPTGYDFSFDASGSWRLAFLIQPTRRGAFSLPSAHLFTQTGEKVPVTQTPLKFSVW